MKRTYEFEFADQKIGTKVIVTTKRLFLKPVIETFICHKADPIMGGQWVNMLTGEPPNDKLESEINDKATASAMVGMGKLISEFCENKS